MKAKIGINDERSKGSAKLLARHLADVMVLYVKTLNFHWNVIGFHFSSLHKLFESHYESLKVAADEIAERIRMLGQTSCGSMKEFLAVTRIEEHSGAIESEKYMITTLLKDHESLIQNLRVDIETTADEYKDIGTSDFLTGLLRDHEKMAWMLRVHLEGGGCCCSRK